MTAAAPSDAEYRERLDFIQSCCQDYTTYMVECQHYQSFFPENAPTSVTNTYYALSDVTRKELAPGVKISGRHRIDRHKIAAGLVTAIHATQPICTIAQPDQPDFSANADFCLYALVTFLTKWHARPGSPMPFTLNLAGELFCFEYGKWLEQHSRPVPLQIMAQTVYLLESCCFLETDHLRSGCSNTACKSRKSSKFEDLRIYLDAFGNDSRHKRWVTPPRRPRPGRPTSKTPRRT